MSDKTDDQDQQKQDHSHKEHEKSGGNMGAGRSGTEDLGSEKPADGEDKGSNKPGHRNEKS